MSCKGSDIAPNVKPRVLLPHEFVNHVGPHFLGPSKSAHAQDLYFAPHTICAKRTRRLGLARVLPLSKAGVSCLASRQHRQVEHPGLALLTSDTPVCSTQTSTTTLFTPPPSAPCALVPTTSTCSTAISLFDPLHRISEAMHSVAHG
jgi:hypothetical protein